MMIPLRHLGNGHFAIEFTFSEELACAFVYGAVAKKAARATAFSGVNRHASLKVDRCCTWETLGPIAEDRTRSDFGTLRWRVDQ